jgi:hypothetical protein
MHGCFFIQIWVPTVFFIFRLFLPSIFHHFLTQPILLSSIFPWSPPGPYFITRSYRYDCLKLVWPIPPRPNLWLYVFCIFYYPLSTVWPEDLYQCVPFSKTFPMRYDGPHPDTCISRYGRFKTSDQQPLIIPVGKI